MPESSLVNAVGAAEYLATTEWHVRSLSRRGELAHVRVGKFVRFRITDLDAYLERRSVVARDNS
jgi:excisionase family DNA binding protein